MVLGSAQSQRNRRTGDRHFPNGRCPGKRAVRVLQRYISRLSLGKWGEVRLPNAGSSNSRVRAVSTSI